MFNETIFVNEKEVRSNHHKGISILNKSSDNFDELKVAEKIPEASDAITVKIEEKKKQKKFIKVIKPGDKVKIHPACQLIEKMDDETFEKYKKRISKSRLLHPVTMCDGVFVGNINYLRACQESGKTLQVINRPIDNPYDYVMSRKYNLAKMSKTQRAVAAVEEEKLVRKTANKQPGQTWRHYLHIMFYTSKTYIGDVKRIHAHSEKLFNEVKNGKKTISAALKEINPPKEVINYLKAHEVVEKLLEKLPQSEDTDEFLLDLIPLCQGKVRDAIQAHNAKSSQKILREKCEEVSYEQK